MRWLLFLGCVSCDQGAAPAEFGHESFIRVHHYRVTDQGPEFWFDRTVSLTGDGRLDDERDKPPRSVHVRIPPARFAAIVKPLAKGRFFSLEAYCGRNFDHGTFTSIELNIPVGHKTVTDTGGCDDDAFDAALRAILDLADRVPE